MFLALHPGLALSRRVSQGCIVHGVTVSVSSSLRQEVYARRTPACVTATPSSSAQDVKIILGRVKRDYCAARRIVFWAGLPCHASVRVSLRSRRAFDIIRMWSAGYEK